MVNQHDVESLQSSGHLSYIYTIFNGALPQTNDWQFSHPPLHHIISALFVKLSTLANFSLGRAFENIQHNSIALHHNFHDMPTRKIP